MEKMNDPAAKLRGILSIKQLDNGEWQCDLPDVFDQICEMLKQGQPFAFSRFGDGEFNAIFGKQGANCDGHQYFPDMGKRLGEIVMSKPDYLMGLQPLALRQRGNQILDISEGIDWVNADCLHNASIKGRIGEFVEAMPDRRVILVGPDHLKEWAYNNGCAYMYVRSKNCWQHYNYLKKKLIGRVVKKEIYKNVVFLFCASMMSNVLIDDLYRINPNNTYIDCGSVFDVYAGVKSRRYHHKLKL